MKIRLVSYIGFYGQYVCRKRFDRGGLPQQVIADIGFGRVADGQYHGILFI